MRIVDGSGGSSNLSLRPLSSFDLGDFGAVGPLVDGCKPARKGQIVFFRTRVVLHPQNLSSLDFNVAVTEVDLLGEKTRIDVLQNQRRVRIELVDRH